MKRLFVLALLCPLFCVAYGQDVIAFKGETVTPQSRRLLKVKDSTNLWGIDLQDGECVEIKLVSENINVYYYTVNRKCVQGKYGSTLNNYYEIPHLPRIVNENGKQVRNDGPAFWNSATLLITKDSLPLEIKTKNGGKTIARFIFREKPKYESFDTIDNKQFREGCTLKDYISSKLMPSFNSTGKKYEKGRFIFSANILSAKKVILPYTLSSTSTFVRTNSPRPSIFTGLPSSI